MKFQGRCYKCSRAASWQKTVAVHVITLVKPAADSAILQFVVGTDWNLKRTPTPNPANEGPNQEGGEAGESTSCHPATGLW